MIGRLLLEWRTKQALEYEKKNRQYTNEEMFQDDQMIYLLAPHSSALQTDTTKFKQDFIGPLFIDTAIDKTHYRLKDATGLLLDGMYHLNRIKKGSACTPQGIVNTFDGYQKALKNTLALFLKNVISKYLSNDFLHHDLQFVMLIMMLINSVTFTYVFFCI